MSSKRRADWSWESYSVRLCDTTGASFTQDSHKAKDFCPLLTVRNVMIGTAGPIRQLQMIPNAAAGVLSSKRKYHSGGQHPPLAACVSENRGKHGGLNGSGPGHIPDLLPILIPWLIRPLPKVRKIQAATSIGQCTIKISFDFFLVI